jgi:hypothetical protein
MMSYRKYGNLETSPTLALGNWRPRLDLRRVLTVWKAKEHLLLSAPRPTTAVGSIGSRIGVGQASELRLQPGVKPRPCDRGAFTLYPALDF